MKQRGAGYAIEEKIMRRTSFFQCALSAVAIISATVVIVPGASIAHQGATGVVKQRMDAMKSVAASMKVLLQMERKQKRFDALAASRAASTIAGHSRTMPRLFPKGSTAHPSEAREEIWTRWDEFTRLMKDMEQASRKYVQKAQSATGAVALSGEFRALAASCSACHRKFRAKH